VCNDTVQYSYATATLVDQTSGATTTLLAKTCTKTGQWVQVTSGALTAGDSVTLTLSNQGEVYQSDYGYTLYDNVQLTGCNGSGGGSGGSSAGGSGGGSAGGSGGGSAGGSGGGSGVGSGSSGSVGPTGGTVDHLYFAVIGDTRPYNIDDTANYPTAIIDNIYKEIQALSPQPQFVVATGDYMYANISAGTAQPQVNDYMAARQAYTGTFFPAMGNHECDGYTADNCTSFTQSDNIKAFMSSMITPLGLSVPYYEVDINGLKGDFTSKLLVIACNYWNTAQQSWLTSALARPTTYTILARHEDSGATTGPCVNTVETMMKNATYNLSLVGHSHTFSVNASTKEIIVGNGGVQQTAVPYGFATFEELNGSFQIKQYDQSTGLSINTYTVQ